MTTNDLVGGLEQISVPAPTIMGLVQPPALASSVAGTPTGVAVSGDTINLSDRALQELQADVHRLGTIPVAHLTGDELQDTQSALNSYKLAQKNVDATAFKPEYQAFVDTINDPTATDDQKLQAYVGFKANQAVEHGQRNFFGTDAVDFKFDWLTRNSDFMIRARADDKAVKAFNEAETQESKRTGLGRVPAGGVGGGHRGGVG